jgi:GH18 family chitinase
MKRILVSLLIAIVPTQSWAQKLAAYFPSYRSAIVNSMQWNKLTDVYFAFINANTNGTLITSNPSDAVFGFDAVTFDAVKSKCQQNNVRLHISVGGADNGYLRAQRLRDISRNPTARATFAQQIVSFAITHNLAGINLDWEFPNESNGGIGGNTTDLFNLASAIKTQIASSTRPGLTFGIAVGGEWAGTIKHTNYISTSGSNSVLNIFDEFHIMAYDFPAGTSQNGLPYDPNHHSSVTDAIKSLEEWNLQKNIPYSKMLLGVPFYGRRANRTTDDIQGMYVNFSNANPPLAFQNSTGSFVQGSNTWYYDSKTQLDQKIDNAISVKGCMGVFIWDLGQDRTDQYSLLSAMKTKLDAACPIGTPNLGPDIGFCTGSEVLNSNLTTASGRTFTWQKDGVNIAGYVNSPTATSITVSQGGLYKVIVKQGNCQKEDEIVVLAGSSFTANGASRCGSGPVTLSVNATTGNFDWYDAPIGGTKLFEGNSSNGGGRTFTTNVNTTTDFYVQKNTGSQTFITGKSTYSNSPNPPWIEGSKNDNNTKPKYAQRLTIYTDVTINSVKVFKNSGYAVPNAKVIIYKSNGSTVHAESNTINIGSSDVVITIPVNITLQGSTSGTVYYIGIYADLNGGVFILDRNQNATDFTQSGVFTLNRFAYRSYSGDFGIPGSETTDYGQLFDIQISTGIQDPCGRVKVTATVNPGADLNKTAIPVKRNLCYNENGVVRILNSEVGTLYQVVQGNNNIGLPVEGNGSSIDLAVPSSLLLGGMNVFNINVSRIGCGISQLSDTVGFNVTPFPNTSYVTTSGGPVCQGSLGSITLSGSQTGRSYQVFNGNVALGSPVAGTGSSINLTFPTTGLSTGINTLIVKVLTSACANVDIPDTVNLRVNAVPAQPSQIQGNTSTCINSSNVYSVNHVNGVSYNWSSATGTISGSGNSVTISYTTTGIKTISVTANQNGCTSTPSTLNVTVNNLTTPTITFDNVIKTYGDPPFTMIATSNSSGTISYSLVTSNPSNIINLNSTTGSISILGAGTAVIRANQSSSGCFTGATADATLTINKAQGIVSITSPNNAQAGSSIILTANSNSGGALNWSIVQGNANLNGNILNLIAPGQVIVKVDLAETPNYTSASATQVINVEGPNSFVGNDIFNSVFEVYPNPIVDDAKLIINVPQQGYLSIELFTVDGNLVSMLENKTVNIGQHNYLLKDLKPGLYILKMRFNESIRSKFILKY